MTGSGTLADPYIIYDVDDLQDIELDLTAYYELANDIDASATIGWNGGDGFIPISSFEGRLDGKGYTITGLFINEALTDGGLFDEISGMVTDISVRDLTLANVDITGKDVAALCNDNYGGINGNVPNIVNVHSSGTVTGTGAYGAAGLVVDNQSFSSAPDLGGYIHQCFSSCIVSSTGSHAGGLVAVQGCFMTQSFATGDVTGGIGVFDRAGGCIGNQVSVFVTTITRDCYARGNVAGYWVGGFSEGNDGIQDNCYSTGTVTASGGFPPNEGGFQRSNTGTVTDCFWDTESSGEANSPGGGTGRTTAQMKTQSTFTDAGWNFATIWGIVGSCNNDYPCLVGVTPNCLRAGGMSNLGIGLLLM